MRFYAGIGSRETPKEVLDLMTTIAYAMATGFSVTLRSGGASGADQAFEYGARLAGQHPEIFLPWASFEGGRDNPACVEPTERAMEIAANYHPRWQYLKRAARKLHARNVHQVLGLDCETPSDMVICWTPDGEASGGTGQALRIAEGYGIPVLNLHSQHDFDALSAVLNGFEPIPFDGLDSLPDGV